MAVWAPRNINILVSITFKTVFSCSSSHVATSHPFGVPEDHTIVPTSAQGDSDGFEPPTLPVYTAEDEGMEI